MLLWYGSFPMVELMCQPRVHGTESPGNCWDLLLLASVKGLCIHSRINNTRCEGVSLALGVTGLGPRTGESLTCGWVLGTTLG
jgi:hypothetical protein